MTAHMHLFGLLHTSDDASGPANSKLTDRQAIVDVYVRDAITLGASLARAGIDFTLVCSEPARIGDVLTRFGGSSVQIQAIEFALEIPAGIPFYSAHHKLDLIGYLGTLPESDYVGFVDLDVIALGDQPAELRELVEQGTPLVYEITDQVAPAFGRNVIVHDLEKLGGAASSGRWYGGELIAGKPEFFRALRDEVDRLYPAYVEKWRELHHQGDEMVVSAALERLRAQGRRFADAGALGIVRRYWSIRPLHAQPRFDAGSSPFLLHLPADKEFLAALSADEQVDPALFLAAYRRRLRRRSVPNLARRVLRPVRRATRAASATR
jgi:hypothetical protein